MEMATVADLDQGSRFAEAVAGIGVVSAVRAEEDGKAEGGGLEARKPGVRSDDALLDGVPRDLRQVYQMRTIIESVVDLDSFFEVGAAYGRSAICGLARLDGWPVAVLAGAPYHYGGGWTADSSQKVTRFLDLS